MYLISDFDRHLPLFASTATPHQKTFPRYLRHCEESHVVFDFSTD